MPSAWEVVTDAAIPSAAILVSTGIAIVLARNERRESRTARQQEREEALRAQLVEHERAAADRELTRRTSVLEELIAIYGFFISAHPTLESWEPILRALRAKLVVLQTIPSAEQLSMWLVSQQDRGSAAMQHSLQNPYAAAPESTGYLDWQAPLANWAHEMINAIASWMRGEVSDEEIRLTLKRDSATSSDSPPACDGRER